ncbi:DUF4349 domain-containing protein [Evansella tamaricis]|uniref:DUF4349 domain-containing protein n=1 Tax=Evansella tamaricis TaxID=2069301 RepID=A0ABS6JJD2_9BACI|nr:DUF4349 domain-containing protein [Evansella tamaricis]MBU9713751.1 DUF4349 domain-containing protein [Evansella tamaricis]
MKLSLKSIILMLTVFLFITLSFGCSSDFDSSDELASEYDMYSADDSAGFVEVTESSDGSTRTGTSNPSEQEEIDLDAANRMVIYNASMNLEVTDYQKANQEIQNFVREFGGFIIESSLHSSGDTQMSGSLTVRVPQKNFDAFLNDLESASTKVHERSIYGNDVTEEYVDLESRLRSKESVEERLLAFMEEASNTEDLLKISKDLGNIQEEIETIKGRMNYLENHVAYSTVTIYLQERNIKVPPLQETDTLNTWKKAQSLFMDTVNFIISIFSTIIVMIVGLSPIIIPLLLAVGIILTVKRRKRSKSNSDSDL